MKEIFTITNQKGGIGKSTTAHAIGAGLARKQNKTLLVDLDAQANLTLAAGADPSRPTILELMQQTAAAGDVIQPVRENLDILPFERHEMMVVSHQTCRLESMDMVIQTAELPVETRIDVLIPDSVEPYGADRTVA